jgi:uncharacterized membrane protein YuzA (DUF378 family)
MEGRRENLGVLPGVVLPIPAQISSKTVYLVVGLSAAFLIGSVALFVVSRRRKGKRKETNDVLPA